MESDFPRFSFKHFPDVYGHIYRGDDSEAYSPWSDVLHSRQVEYI